MKNDLMIFEQKNRAVVSSRTVAERFEKNHRDILRTIRDLLEGMRKSAQPQEGGILKNEGTPHRGISKNGDTSHRYFIRSDYVNEQNGQHYPEYLCTRDGFSLLAMGFTGQKALEWKLKYIDTFNKMEQAMQERLSSEWLITRKQGKLIRRSETDTIANLIDYAKSQGSRNADRLYLAYSKLVNSLVGINTGQRNKVPFKTISTIGFLEDMILHTVDEEMQKGTHYKKIYQICKSNGEQIIRFAYLPRLSA